MTLWYPEALNSDVNILFRAFFWFPIKSNSLRPTCFLPGFFSNYLPEKISLIRALLAIAGLAIAKP